MIAMIAAAWATDPVFEMDFALDDYLISDVICVEQKGPPNGALAIASSPLSWAHEQRLAVHAGSYPDAPDRTQLMAWLPVGVEAVGEPVAFDLSVAQAPIQGDWLVQIEAAAYQRPPVLAPNFTIVVDVSNSMTTVHERRLPILQDEPGPWYEPVTRLEIARQALEHLFREAPEYSRVSIIAMDALQARALLAPTTLQNEELVRDSLARLEYGVVSADDPLTSKVLGRISDLTFDKCHDNKVVLLTDHVDQLVQQKAVQDVARWAQDDVEVWSFGIGINDAVEADVALLGKAAGGASWLLNSRSDFEEVWAHILNPGGVVASDVFVQVDFPAGAEWREITRGSERRSGPAYYSLGTMQSGEDWARIFEVHLPPGATVSELSATFLHERDIQHHSLDLAAEVPPFAWANPTLRTRALAAYWVEDPDVRAVYRLADVLPHEGVASELRAWLEHVRVRQYDGDSRMPEFVDYDGPDRERFNPFENMDDPEWKKKTKEGCTDVTVPWLANSAKCRPGAK